MAESDTRDGAKPEGGGQGEFAPAWLDELLSLAQQAGITEVRLERPGLHLRLERAGSAPRPAATPLVAAAEPVEATAPLITSPLVGRFFRGLPPGGPAVVREGETVQIGDVVGVVESMRVLHDVVAETPGVVAEVLVEDGQAVEYGQPLIRLA